jgi:two-component system, chemotaxis family, sensor kinase CheA
LNLDDAIQTFAHECAELLLAMENALLRLEAEPTNAELVNEVFRAAHTIKGSAGLFGFDSIVHFAHHVESALDRVRGGSIIIDADTTALLLECCDHVGALVRAATAREAPDAASSAKSDRLVSRLAPLLARPSAGPAPAAEETAEPFGADPPGAERVFSIQLGFGREVLRHGMDPLAFLRYLQRLGTIVDLALNADALPAAHEVDPECCYLSFDLRFRSAASQTEIEQVFEFVRDDCEIAIVPEAEAAPSTPARETREPSPHAALAAPEAPAPAASGPKAEETDPTRNEPRAREGRLIRVDAEKLDQLIDLVGELVIAGAGSRLHAERSGHSALVESAASVSRLVEEVRNAALGLRMVPIGATFQRFHRVVRDVSHELGKDIELAIEGADTELDKSMVEKLGDPLLHLVRNSIDHGIEPVEARRQAGKSPRGRLRLNAYHDSGSVVVEVSDDGGGLRRERILEKAIERGLVQRDQVLSDREVFALIFEAGFSTADKVSNLSGRGVGMDVVRSSIESMRGMVELQSQPGRGTTVSIRLPLTLAIIDGFLVRSGTAHYVIPLEMVVECLGFSTADRRSAKERGFISVRGQALPVVRLSDSFALPGGDGPREDVVVVKSGTQAAGLVVDELLGELQTVIKPLGSLFGQVRGISGSALLGSGEVALILDVNAVIHDLARSKAGSSKRTNGATAPPLTGAAGPPAAPQSGALSA